MLEDEYFPGFPSKGTGIRLPVPDTNKRLTERPRMTCRIQSHPNASDSQECGIQTDYVLQINNIKSVFTEDIPVCADHAGMAKGAARLLFGNGRIVQWKAVETVEYQASIVSEGEFKS